MVFKTFELRIGRFGDEFLFYYFLFCILFHCQHKTSSVSYCSNKKRKIDKKPIDEVHLTVEEFFWIFALYYNEIQVITEIYQCNIHQQSSYYCGNGSLFGLLCPREFRIQKFIKIAIPKSNAKGVHCRD